ncbi:hypothetical protein [Streptacidiphilus sp. P02-A3a]|uniref:hypothetical protein n=1 Tax=Streptacidiphilus sp. P02-A3a TaxID=2704468 RepID=UPI0015F81907|nr:hypothetical protein [Streptacidiphilus sp. P02-A3a]QMU73211.1 hypothetical protein GXP74_38250 [Streptacidiphilus sp. P02-A3a]
MSAVILFSGGGRRNPSYSLTVTTIQGVPGGVINPVETPPTPTTTPVGTAPASAPPPVSQAPVSQAAQVTAWYASVGKVGIATLTSDIATVAADDHRDGMGEDLQADCVQLDNDTTAMQSDPAIPNASAQLSWSSALTTLHQGWWNCNGGFSDNSTSEVGSAVAEIESAGPLLTATRQRIVAVR